MPIIEGNDAIKFLKQFGEINKRLEENPELREMTRKKAFKIKFNKKHKEYWFNFLIGFVVGMTLGTITIVFGKFVW